MISQGQEVLDIEHQGGWEKIVIGSQHVQSRRYSLSVVVTRLSGVKHAREVATLLTRLKTEQPLAAPQPQ